MPRRPLQCRPFRVLLLLTLVLPLLPLTAQAEVVYRERVETFEIGVRDGLPEDIWTAIRRFGPFIQGKHAVGSAQGRLKWSGLSIARRGHTCRLEAHTVDVEVVMTLPEWWRARSAPADQLAYWQCIERTVTIHEKRHAEIWRETGEAIDRAFRRFDDWMPCDELRAAIGETGNRLFQEGARRQRVFDDEDRRRRRYEQCVRPIEAQPQPAQLRPRDPQKPSAMGLSGERNPTAKDGAPLDMRSTGAHLGGSYSEPQAEAVAERNPLDALSGLAAAILAIVAAIAGYFGIMSGVMAWSQRRPHEVD